VNEVEQLKLENAELKAQIEQLKTENANLRRQLPVPVTSPRYIPDEPVYGYDDDTYDR
jgi:cell division protein FtsB